MKGSCRKHPPHPHPHPAGNGSSTGEKFRLSHQQDDVCPVSHLMSVGKMMGERGQTVGEGLPCG